MVVYFGYQRLNNKSALLYREDGFALYINDINYPADSLQGMFPIDFFYFVERNIDILRELLLQGADIPLVANYTQTNMLHIAAMNGDAEVISLILSNNQNLINSENIFAVTPLMYAVANGDIESIELLISYGANLEAVDEFNNNVIDYSDDAEMIAILNAYINPEVIVVQEGEFGYAIHDAIELAIHDIPAALTIIGVGNIVVNMVIFQYQSNNFLVIINDASGHSYNAPMFYNILDESFVELAFDSDYITLDLQHEYLLEYNDDNLLALIRAMPRLEGMSQEEVIEAVPFTYNQRPPVVLQGLIDAYIVHEVISFLQELPISTWSPLSCGSTHSLSYFLP
jgi:hypothetical protein